VARIVGWLVQQCTPHELLLHSIRSDEYPSISLTLRGRDFDAQQIRADDCLEWHGSCKVGVLVWLCLARPDDLVAPVKTAGRPAPEITTSGSLFEVENALASLTSLTENNAMFTGRMPRREAPYLWRVKTRRRFPSVLFGPTGGRTDAYTKSEKREMVWYLARDRGIRCCGEMGIGHVLFNAPTGPDNKMKQCKERERKRRGGRRADVCTARRGAGSKHPDRAMTNLPPPNPGVPPGNLWIKKRAG